MTIVPFNISWDYEPSHQDNFEYMGFNTAIYTERGYIADRGFISSTTYNNHDNKKNYLNVEFLSKKTQSGASSYARFLISNSSNLNGAKSYGMSSNFTNVSEKTIVSIKNKAGENNFKPAIAYNSSGTWGCKIHVYVLNMWLSENPAVE